MFCPKCGTNIPDNSTFCGGCGYALAAAPAAAPVAPVAVAQPGLSAKKRGLSKNQFLATEAAPAVKSAGKIAMGVFAAILALILLATITLNNISVVNLPIVKMAAGEADRDELLESMDDASDAMDKMDDVLEEIEDEFGSKTARDAKKVIKKWEKAVRKLSLSNLLSVVNATNDLAGDVSDKLGMNSEIEELEEVAKLLKTVRTITYIFGIVIALLALWAATKKAVGPCVLGIILSAPVYCLLANVLLGIAIIVAFIVLAVFCSKVNKAWKTAAV